VSEALITRDEVVALLVKVSDIANSLERIEALLEDEEEDDGDEEGDEG
jgi:hypothetical protein